MNLRPSFKMGNVSSKSRPVGEIFGIPFVHSIDHKFQSNFPDTLSKDLSP